MTSPRRAICYDVETVSLWCELSEDVRAILLRNHDPNGPGTAEDRCALSPYTGKIVSIACWDPHARRGHCLYETPRAGATEPPLLDGWTYRHGTEPELLSWFWETVVRYQRVVGWNSRVFDNPFVTTRSHVHRIKPSRNLNGYRYAFNHNVDVKDVLAAFGASRVPGLAVVAPAFGFQSPKSDAIDGSKVGVHYTAGRWDLIVPYNARDAERTGDLYLRLEPSLGLLEGK